MSQDGNERSFEDYQPTSAGLKRGNSGRQVERLQRYLDEFGYFNTAKITEFGVSDISLATDPPEEGEFDEQTESALQRFQEFHGLPVTGELDEATVERMSDPRCGFPDTAEYVLQGNKWNSTSLTYAFDEFTSDLSQAQVRSAAQQAFGLWSTVTPLTFSEVALSSGPDIVIRFVTGAHGDGSSFDGPGGVLAHAFYPPPNGGSLAGDTHMDDAEAWSVNLPASGVDLVTVFAHEFGHALGLAHSTVSGALMYPYYGGPNRSLHEDDVDGIQALYGQGKIWRYNVSLLRTYASYHRQNAYVYVSGHGWRRIQPGSADGVTNMLVLCTEALANSRKVHLLEDGTRVYRAYLT